jgi:hypothetical protein
MKNLILGSFLFTSIVLNAETFHSIYVSGGSIDRVQKQTILASEIKKEETTGVFHLGYRYGNEKDNYRYYGQLGLGTAFLLMGSADYLYKLDRNGKLFIGASLGKSTWITKDSYTNETSSFGGGANGIQFGYITKNFELGYRMLNIDAKNTKPTNNYSDNLGTLNEFYLAYIF